MIESQKKKSQPTRLVSIGTANPGRQYSQDELIEKFGVADSKLSQLFTNSHIRSRYLTLPDADASGSTPDETSLELNRKHFQQALDAAEKAALSALSLADMTPQDIDYISCVTSTGFLCPGLTAHLIKNLGLRTDIHRVDIVGMGCNAGLNAMQPLVNFCNGESGRKALLVCVEICSAAYVFDKTLRTAVVNSLFGDGAAAAVFESGGSFREQACPEILGFTSHIMPDVIDAMRFDYDGNKYSFYLDRKIPYVIGANVEKPVSALLEKFCIDRRDVKHWIIHSGGKKVIDAIKYTLDLTSHDLRHTESVLRDFGNLSSGSFLFSHRRLLDERIAETGDMMVMMTMGPGATIECCLAKF